MNTFVWYSRGTKESGELLAGQVLNVDDNHGTTPPRNFNGVAVCFGAKTADVFQWENRTFKALFNDPRKIKVLSSDKKILFDAVLRQRGTVLSTAYIRANSDYEQILRSLGGESFYCASKGLTGAVRVTNQNELHDAFQEGKILAIHEAFKNKETSRVYVVNGKPVVTLSKSFEPDKILKRFSDEDGGGGAVAFNRIKRWYEQGRIILGENEHVLEEKLQGLEDTASAAIKAVDNRAEMYSVDYVKVDGAYVVSNIIFAPSLEDLSREAITLICQKINNWVEANSRTFKESLLRLINDSSEEEAEEMLGAINQYANG